MKRWCITREDLGRVVREAWVAWCHERKAQGHDVPDHHFVPFEEMPEHIQEVDCRIGEAVRRFLENDTATPAPVVRTSPRQVDSRCLDPSCQGACIRGETLREVMEITRHENQAHP